MTGIRQFVRWTCSREEHETSYPSMFKAHQQAHAKALGYRLTMGWSGFQDLGCETEMNHGPGTSDLQPHVSFSLHTLIVPCIPSQSLTFKKASVYFSCYASIEVTLT